MVQFVREGAAVFAVSERAFSHRLKTWLFQTDVSYKARQYLWLLHEDHEPVARPYKRLDQSGAR